MSQSQLLKTIHIYFLRVENVRSLPSELTILPSLMDTFLALTSLFRVQAKFPTEFGEKQLY